MSNSFNISVKPEIAANLVQILSNASALATIQVTDLPAIVNEINANQVFIEAIIDTQLPNIATQNTNIKSAVDAIADPQLTDIATAIGDNSTAIGIIGGNVDSILALKRFQDYTPKSEYSNIVNNTPVAILNIASGKGFLIGVCIVPYNITPGSASVVVTIDGTIRISNTMAHTLESALSPGILPCLHYFDSSINVTITLTGDNACYCTVLYLELP